MVDPRIHAAVLAAIALFVVGAAYRHRAGDLARWKVTLLAGVGLQVAAFSVVDLSGPGGLAVEGAARLAVQFVAVVLIVAGFYALFVLTPRFREAAEER